MSDVQITAGFGPVPQDRATLSSSGRRTMEALYRNPLAHNLDRQDVLALFTRIGTACDPGRARRGPRRGPRRGQDQHFTLTAALLDTINGATTRLTLPDGRTLDVKIPPGSSDGDTLRLRGQGGTGEAGAGNGDALIELHVTPHAFFRRDGADIRLDLPVSLAEAVLGGPVDVPTPGGTVRMRIPAGSDSLTQLRLRGRGVPAHGASAAGDLTATLRVTIGPADAALTAFLKGWTPEPPFNPRKAMEQGG